MPLIDPDVVNEQLVPALLEGDIDEIYAFLSEHVIDGQAMHQMFETVPRLVAALLVNYPSAPKPGPGEFWAMESLGAASQINRVNGQLIVAALNEDNDRIDDLVRSILTWPDEGVERLLAQLMLSFIEIVRSWPEPTEEAK